MWVDELPINLDVLQPSKKGNKKRIPNIDYTENVESRNNPTIGSSDKAFRER